MILQQGNHQGPASEGAGDRGQRLLQFSEIILLQVLLIRNKVLSLMLTLHLSGADLRLGVASRLGKIDYGDDRIEAVKDDGMVGAFNGAFPARTDVSRSSRSLRSSPGSFACFRECEGR